MCGYVLVSHVFPSVQNDTKSVVEHSIASCFNPRDKESRKLEKKENLERLMFQAVTWLTAVVQQNRIEVKKQNETALSQKKISLQKLEDFVNMIGQKLTSIAAIH